MTARPPIDRILVGIDFSPQSNQALEHAMVLGRVHGARLILAHVVPLPGEMLADSSYDPLFRANQASADLTRRHRTQATDLLDDLIERCRADGLEAEALLIDDNPSDGLARAADEVAATLLVVGSHGRTGLQRFLLGSVAERTLRLCRRDTLVARGEVDPDRAYSRVVVGIDFSPRSDAAVEAALALARPDAAIELVHCWQTPVLPAGLPVAPVRTDLAELAEKTGLKLKAKFAYAGDRISFVPVEATPAPGLCERAAAVKADLIVTGSHGRRGVSRWLLGSVAESVVRHAPSSVLVVHGAPPASTE